MRHRTEIDIFLLLLIPLTIVSDDLMCIQNGMLTVQADHSRSCEYDTNCTISDDTLFDFCFEGKCCKALYTKNDIDEWKIDQGRTTCVTNARCIDYPMTEVPYNYQEICEKKPGEQDNSKYYFCTQIKKPAGGEWVVEKWSSHIKPCRSDSDCSPQENEKCYMGYSNELYCGTVSLCSIDEPHPDLKENAEDSQYMIIRPHVRNTYCMDPFMSYSAFLLAASDNEFLRNYYEHKQHRYNYEFQTKTKCKNNHECAPVQMCDYQYRQLFDESETDAYCVPDPLEGHYYMKTLLNPKDVGLIWCEDTVECQAADMSGFCFVVKNQKPVIGFCVKLEICGGVIPAALLFGGQQCISDDECVNHGVSHKNKGNYVAKCKEVRYELDHLFIMANKPQRLETGVCCYAKQNSNVCEVGSAQMPLKKCVNNLGCDSEYWCDEIRRYCCGNTDESYKYCPDGRTIALLEPKCRTDSDCVKSGNGQCVDGNCCPRIDLKNRKYLNIYHTQRRCNPHKSIGIAFGFGFCNPITKRLTFLPDINESSFGKNCTGSMDCSADGSEACIYKKKHQKYGRCFRNPSYKASWPLYLLALSFFGMCTFPFIMVMIYYFSGMLETALAKKAEREMELLIGQVKNVNS